MELRLKKNTAVEIMFPMVDSTTPANLKSGLSVTDDAYYKDGAGSWTSLPITDTATEIGISGMYTIELTAAERNHDLSMIKLTASGAADTVVIIRSSTQDIDDVSTFDYTSDKVTLAAVTHTGATLPTVTTVTNQVTADVTAVSGDSTAADNLEADYDGTGYNKSASTIGTCTTNTDMVSEPPTAAAVADAVWDESTTGHTNAGTFGEQCKTDIDAVLVDTNSLNDTKVPQTLNLTATGNIGIDWANVENPTSTVGLSGTTVKTATDVETDTADIQSRLPAALSGGNMKADVQAVSASTAAATNLKTSATTMIVDSVDTGYTETTTTFKGGGTASLDATNDHYNGRIVIFTSGVLQNQATDITDYDGTTKVFTVTAMTEAPSDADTFIII